MIKIELNSDELQALAGLMDAGIKSVGLAGVKTAATLLAKLEAAVAEANAQTQPEQKEAA